MSAIFIQNKYFCQDLESRILGIEAFFLCQDIASDEQSKYLAVLRTGMQLTQA